MGAFDGLAGGCLENRSTRPDVARERDHAHQRVRDELLTDIPPVATDDVQDALGQNVVDETTQSQKTERCIF